MRNNYLQKQWGFVGAEPYLILPPTGDSKPAPQRIKKPLLHPAIQAFKKYEEGRSDADQIGRPRFIHYSKGYPATPYEIGYEDRMTEIRRSQ